MTETGEGGAKPISRRRKRQNRFFMALLLAAAIFVYFGGVGMLFAVLPGGRMPSALSWITVWFLAATIAICGFTNKLKPNWWSASGFWVVISLLFLSGAIHFLGEGVEGWLWLPPLLLAFLAGWLLPILNEKLARSIGNEFFFPKTRLGKGCMTMVLGIGGSSGVLGAMVGMYGHRAYQDSGIALVLGLSFAFLAILAAITLSFQIWEKRPWGPKPFLEKLPPRNEKAG